MEDRLLAVLKLAEVYWKQAPFKDRTKKMEFAKTLNHYEVFSLSQIAKIVDLPARDLSGKLKPYGGGGRFEPDTLGILVKLREHRMRGEKPAVGLVELARDSGTSLSCITTLTGIPYSTYYYHLGASKGNRENS